MKIAFLFPGQGEQYVGMCKDIYEKYEDARKIYKKVSKEVNIDIEKISFEGPEDTLNETENTQIAILTESLAILEILKNNNIQSDISAGLSLGEYSALINSGCLSFEEGVKLVKKRGEYMQKFLPVGNWKMAAIIGLNEEQIESVCRNTKNEFVTPANYNTEGQIVISGEEEAVIEAGNEAKKMGARKVIMLNTAGPFHTIKLEKAAHEFRKELENVTINKFNSKVVKNIDGTIYNKEDDIKEILEKHMINPVRFTKTIKTILEFGADIIIEIGPRKNFIKFCKKD